MHQRARGYTFAVEPSFRGCAGTVWLARSAAATQTTHHGQRAIDNAHTESSRLYPGLLCLCHRPAAARRMNAAICPAACAMLQCVSREDGAAHAVKSAASFKRRQQRCHRSAHGASFVQRSEDMIIVHSFGKSRD